MIMARTSNVFTRAESETEAPLSYGALTKEKFDEEIEKGMSDIKAGRVHSADDVESEMKRDYGV